MKKIVLVFLLALIASCSSVKRVEKDLNSGNYDNAIGLAVKKLRKNRTNKAAKSYKPLLHSAFQKAVERDQGQISLLEKDNNPENYQKIFDLYNKLTRRQELIKPLLPINNFKFNIENYQDRLISTKKKLVAHLYQNAQKTIYRNASKSEIRTAFNDLKYINDLSPNYQNVKSLMKESHAKGTDFVLVSIKNQTRQVIPKRLERDLLQFDTYRLNDFWTVYHSKKDSRAHYDYKLNLNFKNIQISPERVKERDFIKEKLIKEKVYVKDSTGKKIESFKSKKVRSHFYEIKQFKTCDITAKVEYIDYMTNRVLESFPLKSGFIFEHKYGTQRGDRRALERILIDLLDDKEVSFPSNEQMIYDAGKDLKNKFKGIIIKNKFS